MKILKMTLRRKWFDMILSGEKKEEYREIKPYWKARLCKMIVFPSCKIGNPERCTVDPQDRFIPYDAVEFRNGYSANSPTMLIELRGIEIRFGRPQWGAPLTEKVYCLRLGKILEVKNVKQQTNESNQSDQNATPIP